MKISIYTICKNEKHHVDPWMNSMLEADYICVLDTGSTDGTYEELLKWQDKYPEKIFIKQQVFNPWRFDVSRNENLKMVPHDTDICMSTDLDERLIHGWAADLKSVWTSDATQCNYKYAWSHNQDGTPGRVFWYNKIHSFGEWEWRFPVHESLTYIGSRPEKNVNLYENKIYLHHYPDYKPERSNYLPLLELRAKENPNDYFGLVYLAHEYYYQYKDAQCIAFILEKVLPKIDPKKDGYLCVTDLYLFLGKASLRLNNPDVAKMFWQLGIESEPTYRENYLYLAELLYNNKEYESSIKVLNECLQRTVRHYSWLEENESWSYKPYDLLSLSYYYSGHKKESLAFAKIAASYDLNNARLQENVRIIEDTM